MKRFESRLKLAKQREKLLSKNPAIDRELLAAWQMLRGQTRPAPKAFELQRAFADERPRFVAESFTPDE